MVNEIEAAYSDYYADFLRLAHSRLAQEHAPISTVTLAHETYLALCARADLSFRTKAKLFAYVSRAMRSLLIDMARERLAQRRSANLFPLTLGEHVADYGATPEELVTLDDALTRLGEVDQRLLKVAEMRVFGGFEITEIADALNLSEPTIKRDWQRAKAFLIDVLGSKP